MLVKHARAKVVEVRESLDSMPDIFGGNERLASLKAQIASFDPMVLDASRFFYPRIRAISAGEWWDWNDNGDWFGDDELTRRHGTFIHCPQYVDHNNRNAENAIGIIIASTYHAGPKPGGWVEIISAIERERAQAYRVEHLPGQPDLLTAMKTGLVTDTSMGCFVDYSDCSVCGNRAEDVVDYCYCVAKKKGSKITVAGVEQDVFEKNYGVTFFEDSVITSVFQQGGGGADFDAKIMSEIPVVAGRRDWTHLILDRRALLADREKEMAMPKPENKKAAEVMGPDANTPAHHTVADPDKVSFDANDPDYFSSNAPDKDATLNTQSKGTSEVSGLPPLVDNPTEKESILPDQGDYPTTGAKKVAGPEDSMGTADPGTPLGGKPPEVLEAEQDEEKSGLDLLEDISEQDEQVEAMDERHDDEMEDVEKKDSMDEAMVPGPPMSSRIRNRIAKIFGWKTRAVKEGEGVLLLDDYIVEAKVDVEILDNAIKTTRSASRRNKLIARKAVLEATVNRAVAILTRASVDAKYAAHLDKAAEKQRGNPQDLIDAEGYDADADAKLLDQSQDTSSSDDAPAVADEGKLSQDEETDDHPLADGATSLSSRGRYRRAKNGGLVDVKTGQRIRRADAEKVLDAITSFLGQGMAYAEAEDKALELYASRRSGKRQSASRPKGKLSGARARLAQRLIAQEDDMPEFLKDDDEDEKDDKAEAQRKRKAADEGTMDAGTAETLESDATDAVTDGDEMIQSGGDADSAGTRSPQPLEGKRPRRRRAIRGMVRILQAANGKVVGQFPLGSRKAMERIGRALSQGFGVRATNGIVEAFLMRYPNAAHKTASKHIFLSAKNRRTGETIDRTFPLSNRGAGKAAAMAFRKALGMEDPDERMKGGNEDELASPATQAVADDQNAHEGKEFGLETDGTSVPAGHEALSIRDLHAERQAKKIQTTRRENRKLKARLDAHNRAERLRAAKKVASIMLEKGMFAESGSIPKQKHAERREANRLAGLPNGEFDEAKRMVEAAAKGTSVPRWTRETRLPREGTLRRPVAASTTPSNGDRDLESVEWS